MKRLVVFLTCAVLIVAPSTAVEAKTSVNSIKQVKTIKEVNKKAVKADKKARKEYNKHKKELSERLEKDMQKAIDKYIEDLEDDDPMGTPGFRNDMYY